MDLVYEPGTKSLYSDLGLILLGEILERVSGQSPRRLRTRADLRAARDERHDVSARQGTAAADRAHRERPVAQPRGARRGARRERVSRSAAWRRTRACSRPPATSRVRADAPERRRLRTAPHRLARHPRAFHARAPAFPARVARSAGTRPRENSSSGLAVFAASRSATPASPAPRCGSTRSASCS